MQLLGSKKTPMTLGHIEVELAVDYDATLVFPLVIPQLVAYPLFQCSMSVLSQLV